MFEPTARAKFDAWASVRELSQHQAREGYVRTLRESVPHFDAPAPAETEARTSIDAHGLTLTHDATEPDYNILSPSQKAGSASPLCSLTNVSVQPTPSSSAKASHADAQAAAPRSDATAGPSDRRSGAPRSATISGSPVASAIPMWPAPPQPTPEPLLQPDPETALKPERATSDADAAVTAQTLLEFAVQGAEAGRCSEEVFCDALASLPVTRSQSTESMQSLQAASCPPNQPIASDSRPAGPPPVPLAATVRALQAQVEALSDRVEVCERDVLKLSAFKQWATPVLVLAATTPIFFAILRRRQRGIAI
mmetsp:Transcript_40119/g.76689  ORF Transcript_40119/g.76689 Transcript_40119/m.76689 type:complete len:309 (+) Transcript_40119:275-1201(+)